MKQETLKILGKKIVEIDGIEIEVELRMVKNCWGDIVFKTWSRFFHKNKTPLEILKEKYSKEIEENKK